MTGFGAIFGNYVRRGLTYRWIVLVPTVLAFALVTLNVTMQPDSYEAFAVMMPPMMKPAEGATARDTEDLGRDVFRSATERFMSSKVLVEVAEKCDPYPELRRSRDITEVVDRLRSNIRIELNRSTGSVTVYATHSEGEEPAEMAARIANTLVDIFIEAQRDALSENATKLKKFLLQEKVKHRKELDRARGLVEEFRLKYAGSLPDEIPENRQTIDRLSQQVVDTRQNQAAYRERIRSLRSDLVSLDMQFVQARNEGSGNVAADVDATETLLRNLRFELDQLQLVYHPDHEKIRRQQAYIAELEAQLEALRSTERDEVAQTREDFITYLQDETRKAIERAEERITEFDATVADIQKRIEETRERITTARQVEGQYLSLQRDVEDIENEYQTVVSRLAAAETREAYGEYESVTPIEVEQRAFAPAGPASPDRLVTSLLGLAIGLGVGVGLAVARHKLDVSYRQADDLRALMPGAVLVTIPEIKQGATRIGRAIAGVIGGLLLTAIFVATVALLGVQVGWWGNPEIVETVLKLR